MPENTARTAAIAALTTKWPADALAGVIVDALATAGSLVEWDSETIEWVVGILEDAATAAGLPSVDSTVYADDDNVTVDENGDPIDTNTVYWRAVAGQ